jgi:hypothetical protein
MKVFTGYLEPPGRGSRVEASAEYLAEDRSMADIARLLEFDGLPPPLDMRAYTGTLRLVSGSQIGSRPRPPTHSPAEISRAAE